MGFGSLDDFKVTKDYNKEKDVAFGECPSSNVLVKEGIFYILLHQKMRINLV